LCLESARSNPLCSYLSTKYQAIAQGRSQEELLQYILEPLSGAISLYGMKQALYMQIYKGRSAATPKSPAWLKRVVPFHDRSTFKFAEKIKPNVRGPFDKFVCATWQRGYIHECRGVMRRTKNSEWL
jgi:hypothetical protein